MSTRSFIGMQDSSGKILGIYCHHDGYPEGVGQTLMNHYKDPVKVKKLIELGAISILRPEIGRKQDFNKPTPDMTLAHHRDRGEVLEHIEFEGSGYDQVDNQFDFLYVFTPKGEWKYKAGIDRRWHEM